MKKNKRLYLSLIIIVALAAIGGSLAMKNKGAAASIEGMKMTQPETIIPVSTMTLEKGDAEDSIFAIGVVEPEASYSVNAKINGEVEKVFFKVGDIVKEGDVLFKIKDNTFNSDKKSKIETLKNQMEIAETSYNQSLKTYNDTKVLFDSGVVSSDQLQSVELAYKNSKASYEAAVLSYNATASSLDDQTDYYTVKSPVDGLITKKNIDEGMFASSTNGFTIIVSDSLKVSGTVPSKYISKVQLGQSVEIYVNTLDKHFEGEISSISYGAVNGSYPIEVVFSAVDDDVYSGMYSELTIKIEDKKDVMMVSTDAVITENGSSYVFKADGSEAKKIPVTLGIKNSRAIEIDGEVSEGDSIVVEGKEFLKDGTKIMVK